MAKYQVKGAEQFRDRTKESQHDAAISGATALVLTHAHFDHIADILPLSRKLGRPVIGQYDLMGHWEKVEGIETIGFNKGGTIRQGNVAISMVPASHSTGMGTDTGPQVTGSEVGYMISGEDHMIYVSGDTGLMADMSWMADYFQPDIGILSAGGHFTMDMKQTAYACQKFFNFKTVIPCHYKTFPILEQSASDLVAALPNVQVIEPQVMHAIEL